MNSIHCEHLDSHGIKGIMRANVLNHGLEIGFVFLVRQQFVHFRLEFVHAAAQEGFVTVVVKMLLPATVRTHPWLIKRILTHGSSREHTLLVFYLVEREFNYKHCVNYTTLMERST